MKIKRSMSITALTIVLVLLGLVAMLEPSVAEARGRGGRVPTGIRAPSVTIGLYSYPFYSSLYYSYYSPFYYPFYSPSAYLFYGHPLQARSLDMNTARFIGIGALDLDVRQGKAEVWVDGKSAGKARDFDGTPSYLWLKEGSHLIEIRKGGFQTFEQDFVVSAGMLTRVKLELAPDAAGTPAP